MSILLLPCYGAMVCLLSTAVSMQCCRERKKARTKEVEQQVQYLSTKVETLKTAELRKSRLLVGASRQVTPAPTAAPGWQNWMQITLS